MWSTCRFSLTLQSNVSFIKVIFALIENISMKNTVLLISLLLLSLHSWALDPWEGIGVVFFRCHYPITTDRSESLDVYDSTFTHKIMTLYSNSCYLNEKVALIEFANDIKGLCVVAIQDDAIKIILNKEGGSARYGWVKKDCESIGYSLWSTIIPQQKNVFPLNNKNGIAEIQFYKNPNGEILKVQIPKTQELTYDYRNEIIKVYDCDLIPTGYVSQGTWMQVDVSYPHDEGRDDFECHRIRCWIRYLDDSGHPLVWYYTRD